MAQYDNADIAAKFTRSRDIFYEKQLKKLDIPSVVKVLNEVGLSGKSVIDYGCGSGFYTRIIAKMAKNVVGVDNSDHMVQISKELDKNEGFNNIEYHVKDCSELLNCGQFDVVFSAFLLNFAQSREMLKGFAQSMFDSLKSKHICCGAIPNIKAKPDEFKYLWKYGIMYIRDENAKDFDIQRWKAYEKECETSEFLYEVKFWYYSPETMEQVFKEVGFVNFKWINMIISEEYLDEIDYFKDFLDHPPAILYWAEKP